MKTTRKSADGCADFASTVYHRTQIRGVSYGEWMTKVLDMAKIKAGWVIHQNSLDPCKPHGVVPDVIGTGHKADRAAGELSQLHACEQCSNELEVFQHEVLMVWTEAVRSRMRSIEKKEDKTAWLHCVNYRQYCDRHKRFTIRGSKHGHFCPACKRERDDFIAFAGKVPPVNRTVKRLLDVIKTRRDTDGFLFRNKNEAGMGAVKEGNKHSDV